MIKVSENNIHEVPLKLFYHIMDSSPFGLDDKKVIKKTEEFGLNKLSEKKSKSEIVKFLLQFKNFFSILLLIGSILSFVSDYIVPNQGSNYIGWVLFAVTILNAFFTYIQEFKAEQAMKSFKKLINTEVTVIRNEKEINIPSAELVPGDLFLLREGDKITVDARIIECYNLKVDHSSLTGESEPQLRSIKSTSKKAILSRNMVFSGTLIQNGSGKAIVTSTGDRTEIGKIAKLTTDVKQNQSHMQKELSHFIKIISTIAIILGILFFIAGFFIQYNQTGVIKTALLLNLVFAIGIIVANVPEGLLPTVTLTLSIAAQKMAKKNALVKNVDSIETLGSLTVICSDKTGTLTKNELDVRGFYLNDQMYFFDEHTHKITANKKEFHIHQIKGSSHLRDIAIACNNSSYNSKNKEGSGDPTEICLKKFVSNFTNIEYSLKMMPRRHEIPFESAKKYMITANEVGSENRAYMKGAPEVVLSKCTHIAINRKYLKLTKKLKNNILRVNEKYSSQGYRVLGFATKKFKKNKISEKDLEKDEYIFFGLVIMQDPPRPEVNEAVKQCHGAGIKIVVISGDQGNTVKSIAEQVGIITNPKTAKVITSEELNKLTDKELKEFLKNKEIIFARSLPEDKLRIVTNLQEMGEIVAVTGDGVNDAPALKKADVGISMGKCGTEVAKEASDIVLLDDNFATITKAIKYGRTVYDNIQSFIMYILTSNMPEILPFLFFVLLAPFNIPLAIGVLLILAIDLGTDMIPAIALGVEKPNEDIMKRQPRLKNEKLCNKKMVIRSYCVFGPIQTAFSFTVFFSILIAGGWAFGQAIGTSAPLFKAASTGFFATIIVTQIFNNLACRHARTSIFKSKLFDNPMVIVGITTETLLLLGLIFIPKLNSIFNTAKFPLFYVWWMIGFGAILLALEEIRKYLERNYGILKIR